MKRLAVLINFQISITERQLRNFNADVYMKNLDIEINYYDFTPAEMGEIISYGRFLEK